MSVFYMLKKILALTDWYGQAMDQQLEKRTFQARRNDRCLSGKWWLNPGESRSEEFC